MSCIHRRKLLTTLALGWVNARQLQAASRPKVIGVLNLSVPSDVDDTLDAFDSAMRELGWVKGTDYVLVKRMAAGRNDVLRSMAEDLVKQNVDLVFAATTNAVAEAQRASSTIPIVFVSVSNPVDSALRGVWQGPAATSRAFRT